MHVQAAAAMKVAAKAPASAAVMHEQAAAAMKVVACASLALAA
jgi:hypothetical protein